MGMRASRTAATQVTVMVMLTRMVVTETASRATAIPVMEMVTSRRISPSSSASR